MGGMRARVRSVWRAMRRARQLDAAMHEEMRFHIEMETARLMKARGLGRDEARRQAHLAFGGVEKFKEQARDTRGLRWLDAISLDARLGVRMLVKHRGLTIVGGFAMAVAIAIGATFFEFVTDILNPALPFEQGDRIVAVRYATQTPGSSERRILRDFVEWREQIRSVEHLAAFRTTERNLVAGLPPHELITVAETTASAFAVTRVPPAAGRYLVPDDEREGAAAVVVIGHRVWQSRYRGAPDIVGRTINLSGTPSTIVGVMPDGFSFPIDHQYWVPFRPDARHYDRLAGPALFVFGRLASGVSMQDAQAELTTVGQRAASAHGGMYERLRLVVLPYTHEHVGLTNPYIAWVLRLAVLFVAALTFVIAVNLAILVYARTVTRLGEIAVRTALGASRRRILVQLFVEALALTLLGAAGGLVLARIALAAFRSLIETADGPVAFWITLRLSPGTVVFALALATLAALIMGVLPGLKATSGRVSANLRELDVRTGARLGPMWTALVVAQVAVAVAVLPLAVYMTWQVVRMGRAAPEFAAEEFAVGMVSGGDQLSGERLRARHLEITSRLRSEPGVSAVAFSSGVPGFAPGRLFRMDDAPGVKYRGIDLGVDVLDVSVDLFDAFGPQVLAGRTFTSADLGSTNAVVVNGAFVREFVQSGTPLGMRFRYVSPYERPGTRPETTYEIVGVVRDFPAFPPEPGSNGSPTIYHPVAPGQIDPIAVSVRFNGSVPDGFNGRFRSIAAGVDPALQVQRVMPLTAFYDQVRSFWRYLAWGLGLLTLSVLLLSAAGIYAMMSFTVAQRTREIAIRAALGAAPHRLVLGIFGRATRQLALGLVVGSLLSAAVFQNTDLTADVAALVTFVVAAIMVAVGLVAAIGPARRGLRIQASEALRADG